MCLLICGVATPLESVLFSQLYIVTRECDAISHYSVPFWVRINSNCDLRTAETGEVWFSHRPHYDSGHPNLNICLPFLLIFSEMWLSWKGVFPARMSRKCLCLYFSVLQKLQILRQKTHGFSAPGHVQQRIFISVITYYGGIVARYHNVCRFWSTHALQSAVKSRP